MVSSKARLLIATSLLLGAWQGSGQTLLAAPASFPATVPTAPAAVTVEYQLPIQRGSVSIAALGETLGVEAGITKSTLPAAGTLDLTAERGTTFVKQLSTTLGPDCIGSLTSEKLVIRLDRKSLRTDSTSRTRLARLITTGSACRPVDPKATVGLTLPDRFDPAKPLVLLIHGLASDNGVWGSMAEKLKADGQQVGYFRYSDKGTVAEAGGLLADCFADVQWAFPQLRVAVVSHSMGGLVARDFLEGNAFQGGIDRLIMLGTPNRGSPCASWRWALDLYQHYYEGKPDPTFSLKQLAVQCNGEVGKDLQPDSPYMVSLNSRPRREGVKYTIVAGDRSAFRNAGADALDAAGNVFPNRTNNWVGVRHLRWALSEKGKTLRATETDTDGVVTLASAKLDGVHDFVVVHSDHVSLACGYPPAAWEIVQNRLAASDHSDWVKHANDKSTTR